MVHAVQTMRRSWLNLSIIRLALASPLALQAHAPSDTFLFFLLTATTVAGHWEVSLRDLQHALGLDKLDTAAVSAQELRLREQALALDTFSGLVVKLDGQPSALRIADEQLVTRRDGDSLQITFLSENWPQRP